MPQKSGIMSRSFLNYISRFFYPESAEVNFGLLKVKYGEGLRKDALKFVNELKSKRVLFASLDHELWGYVFASLKEIRELITNLKVEMGYKGPETLIVTLDYLGDLLALYLSEYEYSYLIFMQTPSQQWLSPGHRERNWPDLGNASKDLILLRKVMHYAISNIHEFAYNGEVVDWEEPSFIMAEHWASYADRRRICPKCGYDLSYSPTGNCPNHFDGTTFRLSNLYGKTKVFLSGTFNNWQSDAWQMAKIKYGEFIYQVKLSPGRYFYKYVVDNEWIIDPTNPLTEIDKMGNINSVLNIP
jgi:hypothetical protein